MCLFPHNSPHNKEPCPQNTQRHSVFCKASLAKNGLDNEQITGLQGWLSDVLGGLLSSCVWPWSTTCLGGMLCSQLGVIWPQLWAAAAAPPEQNNHITRVVRPPWALAEFLRASCIPSWVWSRPAEKLHNLRGVPCRSTLTREKSLNSSQFANSAGGGEGGGCHCDFVFIQPPLWRPLGQREGHCCGGDTEGE